MGYVHLASISGGTDIVSCFVLGVPNLPVRRGEIQGAGLGMAVEIWNDKGRVRKGERGELVCTKPFPSRPVKFWNDIDGKKYHSAYFDRFEAYGLTVILPSKHLMADILFMAGPMQL